MDLEFGDDDLEKLATDLDFNGGFSKEIVKKFRQRIQMIQAAPNELDFYALKSLHFEKLQGKRSHQRSMRLNDAMRLVLEIKKGNPGNTAVIRSIENYH